MINTPHTLSVVAPARLLAIDAHAEIERIARCVGEQVRHDLRRKAVVIGLSGGVDSSVCAALCVNALGPERVIGLLMPEREGSPDSVGLARQLGEHLRIRTIVEDITGPLEAAGCYRRRDTAIRTLVPEYGDAHRCMLSVTRVMDGRASVFALVVESPDGTRQRHRLNAEVYLAVVAATNFKQRVRKMFEYHYADLHQAAVVGTPNLLEYDQGFFVKNGDGSADLKPIAHLYKSQVYELAEALDVPEAIRRRSPTTDTYPLAQSQEEFFFALPWSVLDVCLYGYNSGFDAAAVAPFAGLAPEDVAIVYRDIEAKRAAARYLHEPPLLAGPIRSASHR